MHKLVFFVPASHLDSVKDAVFAAGAGRQGNYEHCCWQSLGSGQFRPLAGSKPYIGNTDELETVLEYRVETLCEDALLVAVIHALRAAHPYEEPAFDVFALSDIDLGRP